MITRLNKLFSVALVSSFVLASTAANAAVITIGGAVPHQGLHIEDASSSLELRTAMDTINRSGLSGAVGSEVHDTTANNMWNSGGSPEGDPLPAFVTYDLGKNYSLNSLKIWNQNESGELDRSVVDVQVFVSSDENSGNLVKLITNNTGIHDNGSGDFSLPAASGLGSYAGFTLDLSGVTNSALLANARLVKLNVLTNNALPDNITAISEVEFDGTLQSTPAAITKLATASVTIAAGGVGGNELTNAVSSELGPRVAENTRNKSGIVADGLTVGAVEHYSDPNHTWLGTGGIPSDASPEWITWDLGSNVILDRIHVWNYMENTLGFSTRGAQDVEVLVSPDANLANLVALDNVTVGGGFVFPERKAFGDYGFELRFEDVLNPLLLNDVRLVRFRITSNHGGDLVGLAEAEFYSTDVPYALAAAGTPEPSALVLGLIALAGLGLATRRRRRCVC